MKSDLLSALLRLSAATQHAYDAAREAGDAELAVQIRMLGDVVMRAIAKAARPPEGAVLS